MGYNTKLLNSIHVNLLGNSKDNINIQGAINNLSSKGGGIVHISSGTAEIYKPIKMVDDVILQGQGFSTKLLLSSSITITATATNGSNVLTGISVGDIAKLEGQGTGAGEGWGVIGTGITNETVDQFITAIGSDSITLQINASATSTGAYTLFPKINIIDAESVDNVHIKDLQFDGNRSNSFKNGVLDYVQNCIRFTGCNNINIEDCFCHDASFHGIFGQNDASNMNVNVTRNFLTYNGARGCHIHGDDTVHHCNIIVTENHINNNGQSTLINSGLFVAFDNMTDVLINGNIINKESGYGIEISGIGGGSTVGISNIVCTNNSISETVFAIGVGSSATDVVISSNTFRDTVNGIRIFDNNRSLGVKRINISNNVMLQTKTLALVTGSINNGSNELIVNDSSLFVDNYPVTVSGGDFDGEPRVKIVSIAGNTLILDKVHSGSNLSSVSCYVGLTSSPTSTFAVYTDGTTGTYEHITMTGNVMRGFGGGVLFENVLNSIVSNNIIDENVVTGQTTNQLVLTGTNSNVTISTNEISATSAAVSAAPLSINSASSSEIIVINNHITRGGGGTGISMKGLNCVCLNNTGSVTLNTGTDNSSLIANINLTGGGSASLGTNSPATVTSAPYTWVSATSSDGSIVYIPAWK